ncbi:unnamed protein product [Zymoseptoria tritici ST99CH_1A5]|uniref:Uncharacterized protein n=1 Tax=Zymoseptoria tritici ST99CH_1A5 TaxID=1276529 RepID=A0A1Y6LW69_ZYMTR|nr:unnamed protein product [Zymoseptoria tritici ST99CH_1A5]
MDIPSTDIPSTRLPTDIPLTGLPSIDIPLTIPTVLVPETDPAAIPVDPVPKPIVQIPFFQKYAEACLIRAAKETKRSVDRLLYTLGEGPPYRLDEGPPYCSSEDPPDPPGPKDGASEHWKESRPATNRALPPGRNDARAESIKERRRRKSLPHRSVKEKRGGKSVPPKVRPYDLFPSKDYDLLSPFSTASVPPPLVPSLDTPSPAKAKELTPFPFSSSGR